MTNSAQDIFTRIYDGNKWKGGESVSGPGSSLSATSPIRTQLPTFFKELQIKILVDAPCGDCYWFGKMEHELDLYIGIDIVPDLIIQNNDRIKALNYLFKVGNISLDILPRADAIFCRDCLVHLSFADIFSSLANFKKSGSRYLIMTTFIEKDKNIDIAVGGWRPLNFQKPPFNFDEPLYLIRDRKENPQDPYNDKSLGVWELENIKIPQEYISP